MNKIENATYQKTRISLENMTYINCKFEDCKIEFSGEGKVALSGCEFIDCQWVFVGAADNTLAFMNSMYHHFGDFGKQVVEATFQQLKQTEKKVEKKVEEKGKHTD